jgi:hypothetical protein
MKNALMVFTILMIGPLVCAQECLNYSGKWQMNNRFFRIDQTGCSEIKWVNENVLGKPISEVVYLLDGQPRLINGRLMTCSIKNSKWVIEYESSTGQKILKQFNLEKKPCNLWNPDGTTYLSRETFIDGVNDEDACDFWAPQAF